MFANFLGMIFSCKSNFAELKFCKVSFSPPANEVWGKVIFSQACVSPSVHGGRGLASRGVCIGGGGWEDPPIGYYGIRSTSGRYASTGMHSCLKESIW